MPRGATGSICTWRLLWGLKTLKSGAHVWHSLLGHTILCWPHHTVLGFTILIWITPHCAGSHHTVLYCARIHHTVLGHTIPCWMILYCAGSHHTVLGQTILCWVTPYCAGSHHTVLDNNILCWITTYWSGSRLCWSQHYVLAHRTLCYWWQKLHTACVHTLPRLIVWFTPEIPHLRGFAAMRVCKLRIIQNCSHIVCWAIDDRSYTHTYIHTHTQTHTCILTLPRSVAPSTLDSPAGFYPCPRPRRCSGRI